MNALFWHERLDVSAAVGEGVSDDPDDSCTAHYILARALYNNFIRSLPSTYGKGTGSSNKVEVVAFGEALGTLNYTFDVTIGQCPSCIH